MPKQPKITNKNFLETQPVDVLKQYLNLLSDFDRVIFNLHEELATNGQAVTKEVSTDRRVELTLKKQNFDGHYLFTLAREITEAEAFAQLLFKFRGLAASKDAEIRYVITQASKKEIAFGRFEKFKTVVYDLRKALDEYTMVVATRRPYTDSTSSLFYEMAVATGKGRALDYLGKTIKYYEDIIGLALRNGVK